MLCHAFDWSVVVYVWSLELEKLKVDLIEKESERQGMSKQSSFCEKHYFTEETSIARDSKRNSEDYQNAVNVLRNLIFN